jgi:hypothetical protein
LGFAGAAAAVSFKSAPMLAAVGGATTMALVSCVRTMLNACIALMCTAYLMTLSTYVVVVAMEVKMVVVLAEV